MKPRVLLLAAAAGLSLLPAAAGAQTVAQLNAEAAGEVVAKSPWRGSTLTYEHVATTLSFKKDAELTYNPYYAHSLQVAPRYYLSDEIYLNAGFAVEQELTNSDWTTDDRQFMWSDLSLGVGYTGWTEKNTGLRFAGSVRLGLPVSLVSQAQTQLLVVSPAVRVSRRFDVMSGLDVAWGARWNQRFHQDTTAGTDASGIVGCKSSDCQTSTNTGVRNAWGDITTGPSISFYPTDKLGLSADLTFTQSYLYDPVSAQNPLSGEQVTGFDSGVSSRYTSYFGLAASYDLIDEVSLAGGVNTPSPQLDLEGQRRSPFFNRFTQVYVDVQVNLDAVAARL